MKIRIASCYFMSNYGSILQAYALQRYLEAQGAEVENICIDGIKKELDLAKVKYYIREAKDFSVILNKAGRVKKAIRRKIVSDRRLCGAVPHRKESYYHGRDRDRTRARQGHPAG